MIKQENSKRWQTNRIQSHYINIEEFNEKYITQFVLENFKVGVVYSILLKLKYDGEFYGMASKQVGFVLRNKKDFTGIKNFYLGLVNVISHFDERYSFDTIDYIELMYITVKDMPKLKLNNVNSLQVNKEFTSVKEFKEKFNSKILPLTMDTKFYGKFIIEDNWHKYLDIVNSQNHLLHKDNIIANSIHSMYILEDNKLIINYLLESNEILKYRREVYSINSGIQLVTAYDGCNRNNTNYFTRKIGNNIITINNGVVVNVTSSKSLTALKALPMNYKASSNPFIGSLDIETYVDIDNLSKVYALGYYTDKYKESLYYLNPNESSSNLVLRCINDLLISKYNNYIFYVHNGGRYDFIFILKILQEYNDFKGFEYYKISTIYRDDVLLKLDVRHHDSDYKICLIDSYNLLNAKLYDLCLAFKLDTVKGIFPYNFIRKETLYYLGNTPDIKHWNNISYKEWNSMFSATWSTKLECLKYLRLDVISLFNVMKTFNSYIFKQYGLQVTDSLTISRLALNIFMKSYLKNSKLPLIKSNMYKDIRQSYFGGITEVYKPYGKDLYYYDVNSLYPYAALNPMPGCNCVYITNDIGMNLDNLFGFFYAEIECNNSYLGLLPLRRGLELTLPNGKWKGWYFSEELKFASSNGYNIKIIKGYNFNKENEVFTNYINDMYKIKRNSVGHIRAISKSLLNNLLGRFGLDINKPVTKLVTSEQLNYIISSRIYNSVKKITSNNYLITYYPDISKQACDSHNLDYYKVLNDKSKIIKDKYREFKDVSLTTASAVTSYARIFMSKIKLDLLNRGGNIFYTDTDSIITDIKLEDSLVNEDLGSFKLEHTVREGYFISGKMYCLVLDNGNVKIKSKQVKKDSLNLQDFVNLYNGIDIKATKSNTITNLQEGSVVIGDKSIIIKHDSYTKRDKIYSNNKWVDTKPVEVNLVD